MAANEIQERYAAGFSLQLRGGQGEVAANWIPGNIRVLSAFSIQDELIISSQPIANPLIIVPLDRTMERARTLVHWNMWVTVDDLTRFSTPISVANDGTAQWTWEQARIGVQPMMLEWLGEGPDYSSPDWLPFNLGYAGAAQSLDPALDQGLFDAVACLFPNVFDVVPAPISAWANNLAVSIFEMPPLEVDTFTINNTLPFFT